MADRDPSEEDTTTSSSLRQASFYFGEGAASSSNILLRQSSDAEHENETFGHLQDLMDTACHIIFVVDCTGSMGDFINSMPSTLEQIFSVLAVLFGDSALVSIVAYEDYSDGEKKLLRKCVGKTREQTLQFARSLKAGGGGDVPEATKTALGAVLKIIRTSVVPSNQSVVFHYTDAAPHHPSNYDFNGSSCNGRREKSLLEKSMNGGIPEIVMAPTSGWKSTAISTSGNPGYDWVDICQSFKQQDIKLWSFTPRSYFKVHESWPFLNMLGELITLETVSPQTISKITMDIVLQLMGQPTEQQQQQQQQELLIACQLEFTPYSPLDLEYTEKKKKQEEDDVSHLILSSENTTWLVPQNKHALAFGELEEEDHNQCSVSAALSSSAVVSSSVLSSSSESKASSTTPETPPPPPCLAPPFSVTCNARFGSYRPGLFQVMDEGDNVDFNGCRSKCLFLNEYYHILSEELESKYLCTSCMKNLSSQIMEQCILSETEKRNRKRGGDGFSGETKGDGAASSTDKEKEKDEKKANIALLNFQQKHNMTICNATTMSSKISPRLIWKKLKTYDSVKFMKRDLSQLPIQFRFNEDFKSLIFEVMHTLMKSSNIMTLTSNPVFGTLWRLCSTRREDKRLEGLSGKLSSCLNSNELTVEDKATLRKWIEESYDYSEEMNEKIEESEVKITNENVTADENVDGEEDGEEDGGGGGGGRETKNANATTTTTTMKLDIGYLILDEGADIPDVSLLRSLARSPAPGVLGAVQQVLSHLLHVKPESLPLDLPLDAAGNKRFLPLSMSDTDLFCYLPHILRPGTKFSLKPAALMAMLVLRTSKGNKGEDTILQARARNFLLDIRGKWLPPVKNIDRPEILSYEFANFLSKNSGNGDSSDDSMSQILMDDEKEFFDRVALVWRLRRSRTMRFDVLSPTAPKLVDRTPDRKNSCKKCKKMTSRTLLDVNGVCGVCVWRGQSSKNVWEEPKKGAKYYCEAPNLSHMTECSKCQCIYACVGVEDLMGVASDHVCHFCRTEGSKRVKAHRQAAVAAKMKKFKKKIKGPEGGEENGDNNGETKTNDKKKEIKFRAPHLQCSKCCGCWISEMKQDEEENEQHWVCPVCEENNGLTSNSSKSVRSTVGELLVENPLLIVGFNLRKSITTKILKSGKFNMSELCTKYHDQMFGKVKEETRATLMGVQNEEEYNLMLRGKQILSTSATIMNALQTLIFDSNFEECCSLCYGDYPLEKLRSPCGLSCEVLCCVDCLSHWYGQNKPGQLYLESHSVCPFCRQPPTFNALRQFNPRLSGIEGRCKSSELDRHFYHAWCLGCGKVGEALPRECAGGEIPEITNFSCDDCRRRQERILEEQRNKMEAEARAEGASILLTSAAVANGKNCPKCNVVIIKDGGCNHMECLNCENHFCWLCGFSNRHGVSIYIHIRDSGNRCCLYTND